MKELMSEIGVLAEKELARAAEKWGDSFNSKHEAYAVIKEEYEEAKDEAKEFGAVFYEFWTEIKQNKVSLAEMSLADMYVSAIKAAAEWVQVCAMCRKAMNGKKEEE